MKNLRPKVDFKKQPYAEPKFMLPPDASTLPIPFEHLLKQEKNRENASNNHNKN